MELFGGFLAHVTVTWLSHSERVAEKHHLQTTDGDFAKAAKTPTGPLPESLHVPTPSPATTGP